MFFNSIEFAFFLVIVYGLYWFVFDKKLTLQNVLLFAAGYVFYGFWDWRFLLLLFFSTVVDYSFGLVIYKSKKKKLFLWLSVINNIGILGVFKYYDFFAESFTSLINHLGFSVNPVLLCV